KEGRAQRGELETKGGGARVGYAAGSAIGTEQRSGYGSRAPDTTGEKRVEILRRSWWSRGGAGSGDAAAESGETCMGWRREEVDISGRLPGIRFFGRKKIRIRVMAWWEKVACPVKRAWVFVAARVKAGRSPGPGIMKLHDDVQTCGYQDVQVMWEMLRTEMELSAHAAKRRRQLWRVLIWSDGRAAAVGQRQPHP
ncbi:hypothetical protein Taro_019159, partial [Colocasia esculenta]|nr:hypothetical protein [Colocasia esculenta]